MTATRVNGGHSLIYKNLLTHLERADIAFSATHLDLSLNETGEAGVPFFGRIYRVSGKGGGERMAEGFRMPSGVC